MLGWTIGWLQRQLGREIRRTKILCTTGRWIMQTKCSWQRYFLILGDATKRVSLTRFLQPFTPDIHPHFAPTVSSFAPSAPALTENQQPFILNNCSNIVYNMYCSNIVYFEQLFKHKRIDIPLKIAKKKKEMSPAHGMLVLSWKKIRPRRTRNNIYILIFHSGSSVPCTVPVGTRATSGPHLQDPE